MQDSGAATQTLLPACDIRGLIRSRKNELVMLPAVASQALEAASDPECHIGEFARIVERDQKLAADVLAMANSVMYSPSSPVLSLHQAVSQLGFLTCKNLIMTTSVISLMRKSNVQNDTFRDQLWRHGFVTALVAMHLNRVLRCGFRGEEFTAGLMHDIGRVLIASCLPDQFSVIDPMTFDETSETLEMERIHLGETHADLGAWFLKENRLPDPLVEVARLHHQPEAAVDNRILIALIAAADHMANFVQRTGEVAGYDPSENLALPLLEYAGIPRAMAVCHEQAEVILQTAIVDAVRMIEMK